MTSLELASKAAAFLDSKKAERLSVIEIETAFAKVAAGIFPGGPRRNGATGKQDGSRERSDSP